MQLRSGSVPEELLTNSRRDLLAHKLKNVFWSDASRGVYVGVVGSCELKQPALGGEVKCYSSLYHHLLSNSVYANVRHLYASDPAIPQTAIGVGVHFFILGLETNAYFGGNRALWYLTPKVGFDWGNLSIFYGYGLPLGRHDLQRSYSHGISLKYAFYLGTLGL